MKTFREYLAEAKVAEYSINETLMSDISDISKLLESMPKSKCELKNIQPSRDYIKELIKNINAGTTVISVDVKGKRKISNLPK